MDDVLGVVVVKFVFDTVEHHLVEKDLFREEISVDVETVGKKISAGDGQRTSEIEVLVQED